MNPLIIRNTNFEIIKIIQEKALFLQNYHGNLIISINFIWVLSKHEYSMQFILLNINEKGY